MKSAGSDKRRVVEGRGCHDATRRDAWSCANEEIRRGSSGCSLITLLSLSLSPKSGKSGSSLSFSLLGKYEQSSRRKAEIALVGREDVTRVIRVTQSKEELSPFCPFVRAVRANIQEVYNIALFAPCRSLSRALESWIRSCRRVGYLLLLQALCSAIVASNLFHIQRKLSVCISSVYQTLQ